LLKFTETAAFGSNNTAKGQLSRPFSVWAILNGLAQKPPFGLIAPFLNLLKLIAM